MLPPSSWRKLTIQGSSQNGKYVGFRGIGLNLKVSMSARSRPGLRRRANASVKYVANIQRGLLHFVRRVVRLGRDAMNVPRSVIGTVVALLCLIFAKPYVADAQAQRARGASAAAYTYEEKKRQTNDIAITIVTSGITCTCARFAEDIRDIVNDLRPDGLRVLPVLGVGGLQTMDDVLFLKGIDMGVVDEDNLQAP